MRPWSYRSALFGSLVLIGGRGSYFFVGRHKARNKEHPGTDPTRLNGRVRRQI